MLDGVKVYLVYYMILFKLMFEKVVGLSSAILFAILDSYLFIVSLAKRIDTMSVIEVYSPPNYEIISYNPENLMYWSDDSEPPIGLNNTFSST